MPPFKTNPRTAGGRHKDTPNTSVLGVVYEMAWNRLAFEAWQLHNDQQRAGLPAPDPQRAADLVQGWAADPTNPAPLVTALTEILAWAYSRDRTLQLGPRLVARLNTDKE